MLITKKEADNQERAITKKGKRKREISVPVPDMGYLQNEMKAAQMELLPFPSERWCSFAGAQISPFGRARWA